MIVPSSQFFLSSQLILNSLIDSGSTSSSFDVSRIQISHVGLVHGYSVLIRILLWTFKDSSFLYLGVIELILIMFSSRVGEVLLSCWNFRWKLFRFTIIPCTIWKISLTIERTSFMIGKLVVVHNKIMQRYKIVNNERQP